jgi:hypothetical protein
LYGSVRGAISDGRPYRDSYPLGRITPNAWKWPLEFAFRPVQDRVADNARF